MVPGIVLKHPWVIECHSLGLFLSVWHSVNLVLSLDVDVAVGLILKYWWSGESCFEVAICYHYCWEWSWERNTCEKVINQVSIRGGWRVDIALESIQRLQILSRSIDPHPHYLYHQTLHRVQLLLVVQPPDLAEWWQVHPEDVLQALVPYTAKLDGVRLSRDNGSRSAAMLGGVRLSRDNGSRSAAMLGGVRLSRDNGSRSAAMLGGVRLSRDNGSRSAAMLGGVRLSRDNGSRSAAMLGGVSRRRKRMAEGSGKLDEPRFVDRRSIRKKLLDGRDSIKDRSYRRPVRTSEKYKDNMEPERRITRGMSRDGDRMEENERRALEELSRAMGQDLGVEDSVGGSIQGDEFVPPVPSNPPSPPSNALPPAGSPLGSDQTPRPRENTGSTANLGEEGTQGVVLALMQMVANMNKDMMEERRRREEWEQRRERDTRTEKKEEKKWEKGQPLAQGGVQAAMMSTVVKSTPPNIDEVRRRWPRPSSDLRETRRKEGKCTECGEAGHWLKECPVREAKVKVGLLPPWGEKFGERGGGSGGNAVPLGQRRNLNAVGGEVDLEEDQGKEEDLSQ
ncbi:hypothetical protein TREMEDRAFT_64858 [Tremella mesenterica DSM 1558]|uniref:uncharacterized protein n=1 Tax=Tremella mesenterica (strain ATCC 24925 / CBS 8224 / DSM 1558 / NBRC 9311 / NRRL Y-6157 / RJB 2259-6 / UBC 559-6) TaxID=578456 RepID=UPI0003F4A2BE|nr:uncharacterized protein TREMEDRAFT_64858 [Tremella mesenterica DSM 1558]EIW66993.1 hypothetical protein TREMEDRAFT_64858 [Tremella mesenterica DSM 1558]